MKTLVPSGCFKFKLTNPCKKIVQCFKFKLRKPFFVRRIHFHLPKRRESRNKPTNKRSVAKLLCALLSSLRQPQKETDQVTELKSFPETIDPKAPFSSPMTPAYVKINAAAAATKEASYQEEVEDACQSFETYLVDMIVEDGKVKDLIDVEELLYCWKNLKCPVFADLVCRFYGELCKDLFSNSSEESSDSSNPTK
ncbi:hypothetical protein LIER_36447 [Lithospermum erythrorhizon]|uniref:OVATE domain-containing protein n=1 Tax=Lithospermum erythrorhizon TaxID=34254 RepID=A0AAV3P9U7_LITER